MRNLIKIVAAAALLVPLAACGGTSSGGSSDGEITVGMVMDVTGVAAFAGAPAKEGAEFAIKQANESGELGDRKLKLEVSDAGSQTAQSASLTSKMATTDAVATIFGVVSSGALAAAPVAQQAKMPLVAVQSGTAGVVEAGDYVFRTTAPSQTYAELQASYFQTQGYKNVAVVYNKEVPNGVDLNKLYNKLADKYGYTIVDNEAVTNADTDFTAVASKVADSNPDAVVIAIQGPQGPGLVTSLRRAGYTGEIGGSAGTSGGALKPAGKAADGVIYPVDFSATSTAPSSAAFAKAFKDDTGKVATNFNAEGYDAARLIIEAIKTTSGKNPSREDVHAAMLKIVKQGFDGAVGPITFTDRDARVAGVLVRWSSDGTETVVTEGAK
jgi:branched-chain amino acid transport system substrate-binding protein